MKKLATSEAGTKIPAHRIQHSVNSLLRTVCVSLILQAVPPYAGSLIFIMDKHNPLDYSLCMITIVELPEFIKQAKKIFSEPLRESLINYLAAHPKAGVVMEGTGGLRKIRWQREGSGKSGGGRVVYYYYNDLYPLFLVTAFKKGDKANLTQEERNELAKLTRILIETYGEKP